MACSTIPSDVLSQFYTALRILVTVVFFSLAREPPAYLVQIVQRFSGTNIALLPCFFVLLIPCVLRLVARQLPRGAPKYVDESVYTNDVEVGERMEGGMSEFGSDVTVTQDVCLGDGAGDRFEKFERKDIGPGDRTAGECQDEGDAGEISSQETTGGVGLHEEDVDEGVINSRNDSIPSKETSRRIGLYKGDIDEDKRQGGNDIVCGDEITRAVDPNERDVEKGETLEKKHIGPCEESPDSIDQRSDGNTQDYTHKSSSTPQAPPYDAPTEKKHCAHWDTAPGNELYSSRKTKMFESTHVALETKTRPPWAL